MMAFIHYSHPKCDDCGARHLPWNTTECIEVLKQQRDELINEIKLLKEKERKRDEKEPHDG